MPGIVESLLGCGELKAFDRLQTRYGWSYRSEPSGLCLRDAGFAVAAGLALAEAFARCLAPGEV